MTKTKRIVLAIAAVLIVGLLVYVGVSGGSLGEVKCMDCHGTGLVDSAECETCAGAGMVRGTAWALLPPIIAIGLALITKEVYSSLFIGIVVGGLMYTNFNFLTGMDTIINDGLISAVKDNAGIFIFLVELGVIVALINKSGGSAAFGKWAARHIKTRMGAMLATFALGVLIFIDDYFNCLTVGSVMRPITDRHKISRSKLAYLIDATAAPVCMIAPISSWAAAVSSYAEDGQGLKLFVAAIPFNFYSLLTFIFIIAICVMGFDYGSMAMHEYNAMYKDDLFTTGDRPEGDEEAVSDHGKVIDLVLPILVLIGVSVFSLIYVGGIFEGKSFVDAFADTDATVGLPWGGLIALVFTMVFLNLRKVVDFKSTMDSVPKGFLAMVPSILILTFATSLKNMTSLMGAKYFVADLMSGAAASLANFLPVIIFLVACLLSFATGTSWGTFGILIPIVTYLFVNTPDSPLMVIGISACLAGAVCGDHCSPISDTTIMSSAGAQCNHINHVSTQLPYALTVAAVSAVGFLLAGFVQNALICLGISIVLMIGVMVVLKLVFGKKKAA
ncbi:MAG: Na+/H+ antiporter NhaC family protein [Ruminococcus sp.]|nr:Na+/H+ antiporter NhaC family protein [Ruminococcus sp.]MBQ4262059.1 Na+/H+ antiporter NhaC family protein [Ruminococcus sp.]